MVLSIFTYMWSICTYMGISIWNLIINHIGWLISQWQMEENAHYDHTPHPNCNEMRECDTNGWWHYEIENTK